MSWPVQSAVQQATLQEDVGYFPQISNFKLSLLFRCTFCAADFFITQFYGKNDLS